jgi:hypothetical protein
VVIAAVGVALGAAAAALLVAAVTRPAGATPPVIGVAATAPVVEVLDPTGAIDPAAVRDALGRVAGELARCASDASWTGDALAWLVVDWHGKVDKLELAVAKPAVEACLATELRKLVIAKAQGPATVFARLRLAPALVSGKRPGSAEPPPIKRGEVRATRIAPGGQFADAERVRDALRQQLQDATVCYEQALETKPRLAGTAAIELTVAVSGAIDSVSVGTAPGTMADCLKRAMLRLRLPPPAAVDKVRIELQLGPPPAT